jgi:hypothetical protein
LLQFFLASLTIALPFLFTNISFINFYLLFYHNIFLNDQNIYLGSRPISLHAFEDLLKEMEAADQQEINELVTFRFGKAKEREE